MRIKCSRRSKEHGQGLIEYALLLSLISIVVLVILGVLGLAVTRIYAQMAAALGASKDTAADTTYGLSFFAQPRCGFLINQGIGLYAPLNTDTADNVPVVALTAYVDTGTSLVNANGTSPITGNSVSRYKVYEILAGYTNGTPPAYNLSLCPHTLVVQSDKEHGGLTITAPVLVQDWSSYP